MKRKPRPGLRVHNSLWTALAAALIVFAATMTTGQKELFSGEVTHEGEIVLSISPVCYTGCCDTPRIEVDWRGMHARLDTTDPKFSDMVQTGGSIPLKAGILCGNGSRIQLTWEVKTPEDFDRPYYFTARCNSCGG